MINEMVKNMQASNIEVKEEVSDLTEDIMQKTEKIYWFEKKLNKWVKLFEEHEIKTANDQNETISKVNEVDSFGRNECQILHDRINKLVKKLQASDGGKLDLTDQSDHSSVSRQTGKRLQKVKTKDKKEKKAPAFNKREKFERGKTEINKFKLQEHKLDGQESPVKVGNAEELRLERKETML